VLRKLEDDVLSDVYPLPVLVDQLDNLP
jgi:hypothetical protein